MDPRILVALTPVANDLAARATDALLAQAGVTHPEPARRRDVEEAQAALIGLRARAAHDPHEAALFATMIDDTEARLELAIEAVSLGQRWREIDARSAFIAGVAQGAAASARVLGPIALRMALAAVVA